MKYIHKWLLTLFHAAEWCLIAAAAVLILLMLAGIRPYAVKTGSMEPAIPVGSLCFVNHRAPFEAIREQDIIAFKVGEMLVTHRAVRMDGDCIITQGDANTAEDSMKITRENYIGKTVFWIPYAGELLLFARTRLGTFLCMCTLVSFLLAGFLEGKLSHQEKVVRKREGVSSRD